MEGYIHSLESFGTVDGPGVRLVVFFQGCPMRCRYCHNPDTWEPQKGQRMTAEEILAVFRRNRAFYRNGGITASGGEPMLQLPFLTELFTRAKSEGIHTCLDTSGICFQPQAPEPARALLAVTDLVMLDIKHTDSAVHRRLTGHGNAEILAFAHEISAQGVPLWIRHVLVPGWTDSRASQEALGTFLAGLKMLRGLDVLPYHDMGRKKYEALHMAYPLGNTPTATAEQAAEARAVILAALKRAK